MRLALACRYDIVEVTANALIIIVVARLAGEEDGNVCIFLLFFFNSARLWEQYDETRMTDAVPRGLSRREYKNQRFSLHFSLPVSQMSW